VAPSAVDKSAPASAPDEDGKMVGILLLVDIRPIFDQLASRPSRSGSKPHHSHNGSVQDLLGDTRAVARAVAATPEYAKAYRRRKKVEMLFAHLKRILRP
jgi:hypothetical protein